MTDESNLPDVHFLEPEDIAYLVPRILLEVNLTRDQLEAEAKSGRFSSDMNERAWMILKAIDPEREHDLP